MINDVEEVEIGQIGERYKVKFTNVPHERWPASATLYRKADDGRWWVAETLGAEDQADAEQLLETWRGDIASTDENEG